MYYDPYGNSYYSNYNPFSPDMMARQRGLPMAVKVADLVRERPRDEWVAFVDQGIKPKFATVFAKLFLKVNEEDEAFPFIERLAGTNPRTAKELAEEFVRVGPRTMILIHSSFAAAGSFMSTDLKIGRRVSH